MVRNKGDDAFSGHFGNSAFGQTEKSNVEIVQIEFFDSPAALGGRGVQSFLIRLHKALFFFGAYASKGIVRGIAQNNQNLRLRV